MLNACLASGDVARAEEVAKRIQRAWQRSADATALSSVLPPRVHADFIKTYLASSLVPVLPPVKGQAQAAATREALAEAEAEAPSPARAELIQKAWIYFDSLADAQWLGLNADGRKVNLAIDASVLAAMFKGLVAAGPGVYAPDHKSDPRGKFRPITYLLKPIDQLKISLLDVMRESIWDVSLPSYFGHVSRERALDALEHTGNTRAGWEDWGEIVRNVRETVRAEQEGIEDLKAQPTAELDPTKSKNEVNVSLKTLRTNLSTLSMPGSLTTLTPTARQRLLEESSYDAARQLYMHEMEELAKVGRDKERGMQSNWLQGVMFEWMGQLEGRLKEQLKATGKAGPWGNDVDIEPFLRLLAPDKMSLITIVELLRLCGGGGVSDGMKATRAILHVGKAVENEYHAQVLKESHPNKEFERELERIAEKAAIADDGSLGRNSPETSLGIFWRREMAKRETEGDTTWRPAWSQSIRAKVGSILITALMEVAKVDRSMVHPRSGETIREVQPAFSHAYQYVRGMKLGVIKVNPAVAERMDSDPLRITLHPRFLPMVVKPKPWLSWNSGSYLVHSTQMMRTKDSDEQVDYLRQASDNDTMDEIFTGLDVLGSVPWKINRPVFEVVSQVWNSGEELADIPPKDALNQPMEAEKPANFETDPRAKDTYRHRLRKILQERRSAHSNRCDVNYKLEIGRAFLDETFYFPHNLDFRGRAYPIPPNLSHIGNDMCRGILKFAEAKPLGARGLRWLKIHLANVTGFDKANFDEREAYAMEHLDDVFDSADHPLDGRRWWLKAEDPWQALATCFELTAALRAPVPEEYECGLPIHQDGTCNGLQHYAALGGDLKGAHQVNLDGGDRPSDVYSGVARMANEVIDKDVLDGNEYAKLLQGKVTRKVVKQTVMTTVYGVTFIGAKKQIEKQLKERGDIPAEHLYMCSLYLGRIVLDSIGDVFKGATAIQTWLNKSARLISKSIPPGRIEAAQQAETAGTRKKVAAKGASRIPKEQMTSVIWTTPLGLPVVQPYRKPKKRQVKTALQTVFIVDPSIPAEVDPRAQATAFPPNFIHSLDATHMMMTALACKDRIAFASVHDSYWTHACSVDEMSILLRDTFIDLHSQDILGKLRKEFISRYAGHVVPVTKVPQGLRHILPGETRATEAEDGAEAGAGGVADVEAIVDELEAEDGESEGLFGQGRKSSKVERAKPRRRTAEGVDEEELDQLWSQSTATRTDSKFVFLADIIPPLPAKGDFDLRRIRDSLYFFS